VRAVLTGAAGGIGTATARCLVEQGRELVLADSDPGVAELAYEIQVGGGRALAVVVDLRSSDVPERITTAAINQLGGLEALVNNAAIGPLVPFLATTPGHVDEVFDVNFHALRRLCLAAAPAMIAGGSGAIVNVSSVAGLRGYGGLSTYGTSKGALIALTLRVPSSARTMSDATSSHRYDADPGDATPQPEAGGGAAGTGPSGPLRRAGGRRGCHRLPRLPTGAADHRPGALRRWWGVHPWRFLAHA
jgi:nucleoside-diphosphate-sugar epimerase